MANRDAPFGFQPINSDAPCREYIATTNATIYKGDVLKIVTAGTVEPAAAGDGAIIIGIAAEHVASAPAGTKVKVYDGPETEFVVQCESGWTPAQTDVFGTGNTCTYTAGDSTTGISKLELADCGSSTGDFILLRLYDSPDNSWGEHAKVVVKLNKGVRLDPYAGLA